MVLGVISGYLGVHQNTATAHAQEGAMLSGYSAPSEEGRKEAVVLHHFRRCRDALKESLFRELVRLDFSRQGACLHGLAVGRLLVYLLPMAAT